MRYFRSVIAPLIVSAAMLPAGAVFSQEPVSAFPSKPVTFNLVGVGGNTDAEVRMYAQKLTESLGKPFIVDYKVGGGFIVGINFVRSAPPDGYNILVASSSVGILPVANKEYYDPVVKELAPISLMSKQPYMLVVHSSLPVKSVAEYIAYAKAHPGELNFGTAPGPGTFLHITGEWLASATNTNVTYVYYKGGPPLFQDLAAGRVNVSIAAIQPLIGFVKEGKLRPLAISSRERSKLLPDIAPLAEQGVPGFDAPIWNGFMTGGRTPAPIVNKLSAELAKVARNPEVVKKLSETDQIAIGSTPEEFKQVLLSDIARWTKLVQERGIKFVD